MAKKGMLLDLRRCAGCGGCVVACQMQNNQSPGVSWGRMDRCEWTTNEGAAGRCYLPHACMQCDDPECMRACPTGATAKRDDGIVTVDYEKCIACGYCLASCPYGARALNNTDEHYFGTYAAAPYEAHGTQRRKVAEKCIFCHERVDAGLLPACAANCPGGARVFGNVDDPESDISKAIVAKEAVRIDNTSFYYVPVTGMPERLLPFAPNSEGMAREKAEAGINPVAVGAGVVGVAAVGVGIGVAVKKSRGREQHGE